MSLPTFNPEKWNKNPYIRKSHNCYAYFLNKRSRRFQRKCKQTKKGNLCPRPQPGYAAGYKPIKDISKYTCKNIEKRMFADNPHLIKTTRCKHCPRGYYKGALVIASKPKRKVVTYHFYRQDKNGRWSHKDGYGYATNKDAKGKVIYDPKTCNRTYKKGKVYDRFCGYYCVPSSANKKRFQINN